MSANLSDAEIKTYILKAFKTTRNARRWTDNIIIYVLSFCALVVIFSLFNILGHLLTQGISAVNLEFLTHLPKPVGEVGGGMANAIVGTLILLGIAIVVGVPIGLGSGIYLSEYAHQRFANIVRFTTDVMNGIPSIVYGIFVYTILVVPMKSFSAFSGGVALGIMMIPMIARTSEQFVRMVPVSLREAGLALGVPKWKVIIDIILPISLGGIMTGIMSSLARVAGETAPLLFTAFGNRFWHSSLGHPIAALPLQIFSYAISPYDDWHRQAWAGALILIGIVFIINLLANYFVFRQSRLFGSKS
jgi:phosphate transport system permease protein